MVPGFTSYESGDRVDPSITSGWSSPPQAFGAPQGVVLAGGAGGDDGCYIEKRCSLFTLSCFRYCGLNRVLVDVYDCGWCVGGW